MKRTGIAKYDEKRIVMVPMNGMTEQDANAFLQSAARHGWSDLKIVKTKDVHQTLALVCEPKTWKNIILMQKAKGAVIPDDYLKNFERECNDVLREHKDPEIHKEELTKEEKDLKKQVMETVKEKEDKGEYDLQDAVEEEEDKTWEQVEEDKE